MNNGKHMIDIKKLIEQLNEHVQSYTVHDDPNLINTLKNSATALSALQAENADMVHLYRVLGAKTNSDNAHKACMKPIMCLENGTTFNSIALAAQAIGIHPHSIGDCVRGKQKTSGGFHWAYIPQKED